jgi:hypothetical protein
MSLFDIIRYPISETPTVEELSNLPEELFKRWLACTEWGHDDISAITAWYKRYLYSESGTLIRRVEKNELVLLRKMIREYEE